MPPEEPPGVIVLYTESMPMMKGEPQDTLTEEGIVMCAAAVAEALQAYFPVVKVPLHTDIELALAAYPPTDWVVFNLGEGKEGRLFEESRIVWALDAMGYCYTGSGGDALAHTTHKAITKRRLEQAGVPTPRGWVLRTPEDARRVAENEAALGRQLPFPLIVKPVAEDASLGIGPDAVVHDLASLQARVNYVRQTYRQLPLAEEFIRGRELAVSMWGNPPEFLPFNEIAFGDFASPHDQIVSFAAKWQPDSFDYHNTPVICPAQVDPALEARLQDTGRRVWAALGCKDYARMDVRVDSTGKPYVIEVNCNPDLSPGAGFALAAQAAGYTYPEVALRILKMALARRSEGYFEAPEIWHQAMEISG